MKIKLIDVDTNSYDATFGTCDLCMWVGTAHEPTYEFEKEDGTKFYVDGYSWCWGDLDNIYVDNIIAFADYINQQNFDNNTEFDYDWLYHLVAKYDEYRNQQDGESDI